jgi:hypothetical protein
MSHNHWLLSPDEILGYRASIKADLFKAVMVGAYMMAGDVWGHYVRSMEPDPDIMLHFKTCEFIFDIPGIWQLGQDSDNELEANMIRSQWEKILNIIRLSEDTTMLHDKLIAELIELEKIVSDPQPQVDNQASGS